MSELIIGVDIGYGNTKTAHAFILELAFLLHEWEWKKMRCRHIICETDITPFDMKKRHIALC